jgi:hypothetical protein
MIINHKISINHIKPAITLSTVKCKTFLWLKNNILNMNKIKISFVSFILSIPYLGSFAQQTPPDGVIATQSYINVIKQNYTNENAYPFDINKADISVNIPIRVHIIKNIKGVAGVTNADIFNSVNTANTFFKTIGIQFFIDSVNSINDYNYSFIAYNHSKKELLTQFAVANRINLFLADSIQMGSSQCYGYTYFPNVSDSNFIFLNKNYITGKYLTTMLGHFMGLLSTHETLGGAELASEKNCATSGDFICDTYADPDLYLQVDSTCKYNGTKRDNNGKYYVPSVANIMSNSLDNCKCIFTPLQYRRMYYYYLKYRQYLKY